MSASRGLPPSPRKPLDLSTPKSPAKSNLEAVESKADKPSVRVNNGLSISMNDKMVESFEESREVMELSPGNARSNVEEVRESVEVVSSNFEKSSGIKNSLSKWTKRIRTHSFRKKSIPVKASNEDLKGNPGPPPPNPDERSHSEQHVDGRIQENTKKPRSKVWKAIRGSHRQDYSDKVVIRHETTQQPGNKIQSSTAPPKPEGTTENEPRVQVSVSTTAEAQNTPDASFLGLSLPRELISAGCGVLDPLTAHIVPNIEGHARYETKANQSAAQAPISMTQPRHIADLSLVAARHGVVASLLNMESSSSDDYSSGGSSYLQSSTSSCVQGRHSSDSHSMQDLDASLEGLRVSQSGRGVSSEPSETTMSSPTSGETSSWSGSSSESQTNIMRGVSSLKDPNCRAFNVHREALVISTSRSLLPRSTSRASAMVVAQVAPCAEPIFHSPQKAEMSLTDDDEAEEVIESPRKRNERPNMPLPDEIVLSNAEVTPKDVKAAVKHHDNE